MLLDLRLVYQCKQLLQSQLLLMDMLTSLLVRVGASTSGASTGSRSTRCYGTGFGTGYATTGGACYGSVTGTTGYVSVPGAGSL